MEKKGILFILGSKLTPTYESCLQGKMIRSPFIEQGIRAKEVWELVHSDICSPFKEMAKGGFSCFITFTYDVSRYRYLYLMKHRHESFEKFIEFKFKVEKKKKRKVLKL